MLGLVIEAAQIAQWDVPAERYAAASGLVQRLEAMSLEQRPIFVVVSPAWHPLSLLPDILTPSCIYGLAQVAQTDACLRVIAAELRGEPWPRDPTDPTGGQVRRIERDGRLIGFYLCGRNGVDDGGSRYSDDCFPLYDVLGRPKASDPLPVP